MKINTKSLTILVIFLIAVSGYTIFNIILETNVETLDGPFVEEVYPTTSQIPENILRFYVYFSEPIKDGSTIKSIHIFNEDNIEVNLYDTNSSATGIFLETLEELWSPDYQRITLILDPGRVKTGLDANLELGRSFESGKKYTMEIDTEIEALSGEKLVKKFRKEFEVIPEDRTPPNDDNWKIVIPIENTFDPLKIQFNDILDHAQMISFIRVYDSSNYSLHGEVKLKDNESIWEFYPNSKWERGNYSIKVDVRLEDLAGNNIQGKFDRDIQTDDLLYLDQKEIVLEFTI